MKVVLCEDDHLHMDYLNKEITNYAMFHEPSIDIVLCASKPEDVLSFLESQRADCYLLDIEFGAGMDGLDLAMEIRKKDPLATIIFVTTHADRLKLTFKYKVAALDFIVKGTPQQISDHVKEALQAAFRKYKQIGESKLAATVQLQVGERVINVPIEDIYYIETSPTPHKLNLYERNGIYEFYGKLQDYEELDPLFYRNHKSFLVNLRHVLEFNKKERTVKMTNGAACEVSFRAMKELERRMAIHRQPN